VSPNSIQKFLARQQFPRSHDQLNEYREHLGFERVFLPIARESAIRGIDLTIAAAVNDLVQAPSSLSTATVPETADLVSAPPRIPHESLLDNLDLATAEGARAAHERLHAAARLACSRVEDSLDLGHQPHFVTCVDAAMAAAQPAFQELARESASLHVVVRN
jgi:UrcA family protein